LKKDPLKLGEKLYIDATDTTIFPVQKQYGKNKYLSTVSLSSLTRQKAGQNPCSVWPQATLLCLQFLNRSSNIGIISKYPKQNARSLANATLSNDKSRPLPIKVAKLSKTLATGN